MYLIASSCKCLCYFWWCQFAFALLRAFVCCRQIYPRELHVYHKCLQIAHCNLPSSSWHGQTGLTSTIPMSDSNLMCLTLQTLFALVVWCEDCRSVLETFFKTSAMKCSLFHVTLNSEPLLFQFCYGQVPHCSLPHWLHYSRKCELHNYILTWYPVTTTIYITPAVVYYTIAPFIYLKPAVGMTVASPACFY